MQYPLRIDLERQIKEKQMGRPINKKFFGNTNTKVTGEGVGGEAVATVVMSTTSFAVSTLTVSVSFSAPQIKGGQTATGTAVKTGNTVTSVTITNAGSGYTSAPTVSFTGTNMSSWENAASATLTSSLQNAIAFTSYLTTGSNAVTGGDIIKQESSRRYLVQNSEGRGQVKLVTTDSLAGGQMKIIATDGAGSTFFVKKLTAHKATLVNRTGTSTAVVTGGTAGWTLGAATGTNQVTLASN